VSELVATGFKDPYRAAEVLNELQRRQYKWSADLDNALVVTQEEASEVKVQLRIDLSSHGAKWASLWGSFLGLVLFETSADQLVDAAAAFSTEAGLRSAVQKGSRKGSADNKWWRENLCISKEFVRDIGGMIQPGDSALFILLHANESPILLRYLRNQGGTALHTTLSPRQDELLHEVFSIR